MEQQWLQPQGTGLQCSQTIRQRNRHPPPNPEPALINQEEDRLLTMIKYLGSGLLMIEHAYPIHGLPSSNTVHDAIYMDYRYNSTGRFKPHIKAQKMVR